MMFVPLMTVCIIIWKMTSIDFLRRHDEAGRYKLGSNGVRPALGISLDIKLERLLTFLFFYHGSMGLRFIDGTIVI